MSSTTNTTAGTDIPRWPKISVTLNADGSGLLTHQGRDHHLNAGDIDAARADVIHRVTATARSLERPVRLNSTDPDGEWELAVHPDGTVVELAGKPAARPAVTRVTPSAALVASEAETPDRPTVALTRSQRKWAGQPRNRRLGKRGARIAGAVALLVCVAAAGLLVLTNGPATVVKSPTAPPLAPRAGSPGATASANAAAADKVRERRAARRAAAARERRQHAALVRRVNARQARERRAARRRVAARRAAAAQRAAAAARRRASVATPPPAAARPRPSAAAPVAPPPPPAAPACGEFDLC